MTQANATTPPEKRPARPSRTTQRPAPGIRVQHESTQDFGTVTESDDWQDTLQLRGISSASQVLVEWENGGHPVRTWTRISELTVQKKASDPPKA